MSIVFFILTYGFGGNAETSILYRLGVLNTLYGAGGSLVSSTFGAKAAGNSSAVASVLTAFIYAISFNMPCVSALAATSRETHSVKWTAKIGVFYTVSALLISCVVYHIGLLIF